MKGKKEGNKSLKTWEFYSQTEIVTLNDGRGLVFYYANNSGRGDDNVTVYLIPNGIERQGNCRKQEKYPYLGKIRTGGYRGLVYLSEQNREKLGI